MTTFDFEIFERVVSGAYQSTQSVYRLEEVLDVFRYFLCRYSQERGEDHPPLRREQVAKFIRSMPYFYPEDHSVNDLPDIEAELYPDLINAYFQTYFPRCDYRMGHFFAGQVRELRFYETMLKGGG